MPFQFDGLIGSDRVIQQVRFFIFCYQGDFGTLTLQQVVNKVGFRLKNVIYANEVRIPVSTDFMAVMSRMQKGEQGLSCSEG